MTAPDDDIPAPQGPFAYAMHRVLGPAMGVVIFVVMLVVFPIMIAGGQPPLSIVHLGAIFALACAGFWFWAQRIDSRGDSDEA